MLNIIVNGRTRHVPNMPIPVAADALIDREIAEVHNGATITIDGEPVDPLTELHDYDNIAVVIGPQ